MSNPSTQKKPVAEDWHPADVLAALRKADWSLQQLALSHGYRHRSALSVALRHPYPRAETIIARALGLQPQNIWPSRYHPDGTPLRRRGPAPLRPKRPAQEKTSTAPGEDKPLRDDEN